MRSFRFQSDSNGILLLPARLPAYIVFERGVTTFLNAAQAPKIGGSLFQICRITYLTISVRVRQFERFLSREEFILKSGNPIFRAYH